MIIIEFYKQHYLNKFGNLNEMDKFLYNLTKLTQEKTENLQSQTY